MKNNGYSIFKSNGSWFVRWTEYHDGKRKQPSHKLCSVANYPKESEVKPLAAEYMTKIVRKAPTIQAGNTVKQFVDGVYLPNCERTLKASTLKLYRQEWHREPHLGHIRLRDVMPCDVQAALDAIHQERGET